MTLRFSRVTKNNYKNTVFGVSANIQAKHFPKTSKKLTTRANLLGEESVKDENFNYKSVFNKLILWQRFFLETGSRSLCQNVFRFTEPKFLSLLCSDDSVTWLCLDIRESLLHSFMLFWANFIVLRLSLSYSNFAFYASLNNAIWKILIFLLYVPNLKLLLPLN